MQVVLGILLVLLSINTSATEREQQRKQYQQARDAIRNNNGFIFNRLRAKLGDYPLTPYLDYYQMLKKIDRLNVNTASNFVQTSTSRTLANRFERRYLEHLARTKKWQSFLSFYSQEPISTDLKCLYFLAQFHTGNTEKAFIGAKKIWLSGRSQPDRCDPLFTLWDHAGKRSNQHIWDRMLLAFSAHQYQLLRYLNKQLSPSWQKQGQKLIKVYKQPNALKQSKLFKKKDRGTRDIVGSGLKRLARKDPEAAWKLFDQYKKHHKFSQKAKTAIREAIADRLMSNRDPKLRSWLDRFLATSAKTSLHEQRIRLALWEENWRDAQRWITHLSEEYKQKKRWQYWKARSLYKTNNKNTAKAIFQDLATHQGYYGFWSAHRLGKDYTVTTQKVPHTLTWNTAIQKWPALERIVELKALQEHHLARSEWYYLLSHESSKNQLELGKLALTKNWHNFAVQASIKASAWQALDLRFPMPLSKTFHQFADKRQVEPSLLYAISRQESALNYRARSPAGARGLMQLLPSTARSTAKKIGLRYRGNHQLNDPYINVMLGSAYLKRLLKHYNDNRILASAAYNAGMGRVSRWLNDTPTLESDIWVENIPFNETRQYVKNILSFSLIYQHQLKQPLEFLAETELYLKEQDS